MPGNTGTGTGSGENTGINATLAIPFCTSIQRVAKNMDDFLENFASYTDLSDPMSCHCWSKLIDI